MSMDCAVWQQSSGLFPNLIVRHHGSSIHQDTNNFIWHAEKMGMTAFYPTCPTIAPWLVPFRLTISQPGLIMFDLQLYQYTNKERPSSQDMDTLRLQIVPSDSVSLADWLNTLLLLVQRHDRSTAAHQQQVQHILWTDSLSMQTAVDWRMVPWKTDLQSWNYMGSIPYQHLCPVISSRSDPVV